MSVDPIARGLAKQNLASADATIAQFNADVAVIETQLIGYRDSAEDYAERAEAAASYHVSIAYQLWATLSPITGSAGQSAAVFGVDAGTHTDPVVGGTVANTGIYSYSTSPAGWKRLADLPATANQAQVDRIDTYVHMSAVSDTYGNLGTPTSTAAANSGWGLYQVLDRQPTSIKFSLASAGAGEAKQIGLDGIVLKSWSKTGATSNIYTPATDLPGWVDAPSMFAWDAATARVRFESLAGNLTLKYDDTVPDGQGDKLTVTTTTGARLSMEIVVPRLSLQDEMRILKASIRKGTKEAALDIYRAVGGLVHLQWYGQSLTLGTCATGQAVALSSSANLPYAYMFGGGLRQRDVATTPTLYDTIVNVFESTETVSSIDYGETGMYACAEMIGQLLRDEDGIDINLLNTKLLLSSAGEGSQPIETLKNGATYWSRLQAGIAAGMARGVSSFKPYQFGALFWRQGEANTSSQTPTNSTYEGYLNTDVYSAADAYAATQQGYSKSAARIMYQLSSHWHYLQPYPNIALALLELLAVRLVSDQPAVVGASVVAYDQSQLHQLPALY